jgi:hypothetical protein
MNNLRMIWTGLDNREGTSPRSRTDLNRAGRPHGVSTGQKVIREACDNFLHYELNADRALTRET